MNDNLKLKKSDRTDISKALGLFGRLGMTTAIIIMGMVVAGKYLDTRFGTEPYIMLAFAVLGVAAAFHSLYKNAMAASKPVKNKNDGDKNA